MVRIVTAKFLVAMARASAYKTKTQGGNLALHCTVDARVESLVCMDASVGNEMRPSVTKLFDTSLTHHGLATCTILPGTIDMKESMVPHSELGIFPRR